MPTETATTSTVDSRANAQPSREAINSSLKNLSSRLDALLATYGAAGKKPNGTLASTYPAPTAEAPPPIATVTPIKSEPAPQVEQKIEPRSTDNVEELTTTTAEPSAVPTNQSTSAAMPNMQPSEAEADEAADAVAFEIEELRTSRVMIVDDEEVNVMTVRHHLHKEGFENFITTTDPRNVVAMLRNQSPDVVLLDIRMPHVSGLDILRARKLDRSLHHIPIIVLTASTDPATKREALELGAYDFLNKPVDPSDLSPRVRNALVVKRHFDQVSNEAVRLEALVRRRTDELLQSRQQLILSLARAAEHRDNDTGNHIIRVGRYAAIIARELGWASDKVEMLEQAAQLHDVGKIGIPDAILFKPDKLDPTEYEIIKRHCAIGRGIVDPLSGREFEMLQHHADIGSAILNVRGSPMLAMASRIAQTHHEHWDGRGYPLGLSGEDIPIEGRITAVADVFDALSSRRPYKEPFPREKCFAILAEGRGKQFDPNVLDAFFRSADEIVEVQLRFMDPAEPITRRG